LPHPVEYIGPTSNWRSLVNWDRETWQRGIISQGWTLRNLFQCSSRCSLQVYIWCRKYYRSCSSVLCVFFSSYFCFTTGYVRQTKLASSLDTGLQGCLYNYVC